MPYFRMLVRQLISFLSNKNVMKLSIGIFLIILMTPFSQSKGQDCYPKPTGNRTTAAEHFSYGFYQCALREYLMALPNKPKSKKLNRKIAQCYLRSSGANKYKAVEYLKKVIKLGNPDHEVYLELAKAYFFGYQFEMSLKMFEKYESLESLTSEKLAEVENYKRNIAFSKEIMKHPVNVTFQNLGKDVNSKYNDMHPFITDKEDIILFTTDRKGCRGDIPDMDGFIPDVASSKVKRGRDRFSSARSLSGTFSSENVEQVAGGSPNGNYFIYASDAEMNMQLKMSYKAPGKRSYPASKYLTSINTRNFSELAATITNDGSLMIFSSDMRGGYGGLDLWMSKRLPNGEWGSPINMGPSINTKWDENFPNFSQHQDYFTFSSNGLPGMGGFDLFKSEFSETLKSWTKPKNLGYPVNTSYDDFTITFVKNGRYAYKSDIRNDSQGMRDIYRLTFHDAMPSYTVIKSSVFADTLSSNSKKLDEVHAQINHLKQKVDSLKSAKALPEIIHAANKIYENKKNQLDQLNIFTNSSVEVKTQEGKLYGKYTPNARNGKFIMILEPGLYTIKIENKYFESLEKKIRVFDKVNYTPELSRDFYLKPLAN